MGWFMDLINWIWCILKSFFYWLLENILEIIDIVAQFVLLILPDTPFIFEPVEWGNIGNSIGYVLPISTILNHFTVILTAIAIYYGVRYLLRLIKQIQ